MPVKQVNRDDSAFCRVDKDYRQACRASDHDELDFRAGCVFLEAQITFAEIVPLVSLCYIPQAVRQQKLLPRQQLICMALLFLGQGAKRMFAWLYL